MLLLIDNYDSFTHNLARYFIELGQDVVVRRNDEINCEQIAVLAPDYLVFSPGPCTPDSAGITLEAITTFAGKIPILGVCLGHQAIGQAFGAKVIKAQQIKHGKTSVVSHISSKLFEQISNPFVATRYHSLVIDRHSLPKDFIVSAWCDSTLLDDTNACVKHQEIMAIEHKRLPICGVQFHPESLLTQYGHRLLANFLTYRG